MVESYLKMLANYADFSRRTSRHDYWYAFLCNFLIALVLGFIAQFTGTLGAIIQGIYGLAVFIPGLALTCRRLHDVNKTGWFMLIELIPIVGIIILLIYLASASVDEGNIYGDEIV